MTKTGGKEPCRPQRWPRKLRLRLRLSLRAEARDKEVVSEAGRKQKQDWSEGRYEIWEEMIQGKMHRAEW